MDVEIKQSLISLLDGIKRSDGAVISREMARLDDFASQGATALHPQLLHFLQRRSYAKALMFLEGDTPAAGVCGGRAGRPAAGS